MILLIQRLHKTVSLPAYQTEQSVAMDLHAAINEPLQLAPLQRQLIPCGFALELPPGYEAQIRARSGLALRNGIGLVNGVGTIDSDYRGEYGVILINYGTDPYTIQPNDRIAQMVINKTEHVELREANELTKTMRGSGGFGHTGTQ